MMVIVLSCDTVLTQTGKMKWNVPVLMGAVADDWSTCLFLFILVVPLTLKRLKSVWTCQKICNLLHVTKVWQHICFLHWLVSVPDNLRLWVCYALASIWCTHLRPGCHVDAYI